MSLLPHTSVYRARLSDANDLYSSTTLSRHLSGSSAHKLQKTLSDGFGGLTLLNESSHHGNHLHFVDVSTHKLHESLHKASLRSGSCYSHHSSCGFVSEDDDDDDGSSSCFSSDDDSSFADDHDNDDDNESVDDIVASKDNENGFILSLDEIQKMRLGKTISNVNLSPVKAKSPAPEPPTCRHPRATYRKILLEETGTFSQRSYLVVPADFFVQGNVNAHTLELLTAVRRGDVETIRRLRAGGHQLQCCNRFNETIVHTAARRGEYGVLQFLIAEAGVSPRVCCDTGRTPLHDAAWTEKPNFRAVALLLNDCPDFLGLSDARKCTPLDYIPRSAYAEWNHFLEENRTLLIPKRLF